jgi:hypothetical protein
MYFGEWIFINVLADIIISITHYIWQHKLIRLWWRVNMCIYVHEWTINNYWVSEFHRTASFETKGVSHCSIRIHILLREPTYLTQSDVTSLCENLTDLLLNLWRVIYHFMAMRAYVYDSSHSTIMQYYRMKLFVQEQEDS